MLSLALRNLFFIIIHPGLVTVLIPYWILGNKAREAFNQLFTSRHYVGLIIFIAGIIIMLSCIVNFAVKGRGTLSPADPTKHLVTGGLYSYSRNPMYVGVMLILTGEAIFFDSNNLWIYSLFIFIAFNLFILLHEEPRLRKDFREKYNMYCQSVRRWI